MVRCAALQLMLVLLAVTGAAAAAAAAAQPAVPAVASVAATIRPTAVLHGRDHFLADLPLAKRAKALTPQYRLALESARAWVPVTPSIAARDARAAEAESSEQTGLVTVLLQPFPAIAQQQFGSFGFIQHSPESQVPQLQTQPTLPRPQPAPEQQREPQQLQSEPPSAASEIHRPVAKQPLPETSAEAPRPPPNASIALHEPLVLAVASGGSSPRVQSPTASMASQYFPRHDPFNKGGLLRIRGVAYQPTPPGLSPLADDAPDLYGPSFAHVHARDLGLLSKLGANVVRLYSFGGANSAAEVADHSQFLNAVFAKGLFVILTFSPEAGTPR